VAIERERVKELQAYLDRMAHLLLQERLAGENMGNLIFGGWMADLRGW
jgi:hypothetical protein